VRYEPDHAGLGELLRSGEMQQVMRGVAGTAMADAVATAPFRTGEYKSSFSVHVTDAGGRKGDRAEADVINDSGHAVLVEWTDDFHTLRNSAERLA
jgi:hypothetical protein